MSYSLRFVPELEEDLVAAFRWYEDRDMVIIYRIFHRVRNPSFVAKLLDSHDGDSVMNPKP